MTSPDQETSTSAGEGSLTSPVFLLLNLAYLLVFSHVALYYLYPIALDDMGAGSRMIGWVMGVFSLAAVLSRPLMGVVAAGRGEFFLMKGGMAVLLAASVCYPLLAEVGPLLLLVRVVHGLGFSGFVGGSFSAVARLFPDGRRAEAYSLVGASIMGAVALAPPAGEVLIARFGFETLLVCASALVVLAWGAVKGAGRGAVSLRRRESPRRTPYLPLLRSRSFLLLLVSTLIFAHSQSTLFNFLALAAERRGAAAGGFFFGAFALAIGILLTMGRWIDRGGKHRFLRMAYPALALGLLLLPVFLGRSGVWIPALLFGAGMGFLFPAHNALAADHGGGSEKPAVMAVFTAVYDSGFITGAVASGWIAAWLDLDGLFYATGAMAAAGWLICLAAPFGSAPGRGGPGSTGSGG